MNLKATNLALLLALISAVCQAQEFSADVMYVATSKPGAPAAATGNSSNHSAKLYVNKDKMRLETRGLTGTILLVDGGERTAYALFPAQKTYQPLATGPSEYFGVENADDACPDWQKASSQKIVCEKIGPEMVDGRPAVKYQNKRTSEDAPAAVWIDSALKFVVKWETATTGAELREIKEEKLSSEMFVVSDKYKPMMPQKGSSKGFASRKQ